MRAVLRLARCSSSGTTRPVQAALRGTASGRCGGARQVAGPSPSAHGRETDSARPAGSRAANQSAALLARSTSDKVPPQAQKESTRGALTSARPRHHIDAPASVVARSSQSGVPGRPWGPSGRPRARQSRGQKVPPIGAKVPQVPGRSTAITQNKSYERNFPPLEPTRHTLTGASQPSTYGSSGCRSSAHVKLDALSAADGLAMSTTPSRTAGQGPQVGFDPSAAIL